MTGLVLSALGAFGLAGVASYYGYAAYARSNLDQLNYSIEQPALPNGSSFEDTDTSPTTPVLRYRPSISLARADIVADIAAESSPDPAPEQDGAGAALPAESYASIYPGERIHPKYWDNPAWAGTDLFALGDTRLPDGYARVSPTGRASPARPAKASNIRIPILGVDSAVSELSIIDLGDSRQYESPDNVVGHIPETANPGQLGNGWFFGHLESPLKGEGSVFRKLPKIPEYLRDGDPVYVSLETDDGEHLYQVTATRVVHQDDLELYSSDDASITLVSCVPRLVYDHRLVVTAKLVGFRN